MGKLISGQKEMGGKSGAAAENCRKPADAMQSVATDLQKTDLLWSFELLKPEVIPEVTKGRLESCSDKRGGLNMLQHLSCKATYADYFEI